MSQSFDQSVFMGDKPGSSQLPYAETTNMYYDSGVPFELAYQLSGYEYSAVACHTRAVLCFVLVLGLCLPIARHVYSSLQYLMMYQLVVLRAVAVIYTRLTVLLIYP
ncbi:hypothetical protein GY45DRAFT_819134 [Cubamyces sp. BRFM 1775]|nr:hypothetical protein GY45DRAFT_819134 [Cubamyces sp. BRFM 1775]